MEKRKLGEQLVITVDKKKHLMKEVEGWGNHIREVCIINESGEVRRVFAKDLGILNDVGCLPCPFCEEYPEIKYGIYADGWHYVELSCCKYVDRMSGYSTDMEGFFRGMIERWNRRV